MKKHKRITLKDELLELLDEGDNLKNISIALIEKATKGDIKAYELIQETIGEKPVNKQDLKSTDINIIVADDKHKKMLEEL